MSRECNLWVDRLRRRCGCGSLVGSPLFTKLYAWPVDVNSDGGHLDPGGSGAYVR